MSKTVLITGTSTGIGKACALYLDKLGFKVYAGVRKLSDAATLEKETSDQLKPIIMDVTNEHTIAEAVHQIQSEVGHLDGLINNAGVGISGALEVTPVDEMKKLLNVNVVGLMSVTKAFLPLLRASRGRIINIGSSSGYLAMPGASVYSASKFAVRAITDALRLELYPFDIKVILVSPGAIESAIWDKGKAYKETLQREIDPEIASLYDTLRRFGNSLYTELKRIPAVEVAKVVEEALTNKSPKRYYTVGRDAKGAKNATYLPMGVLDRIILKKIERFSEDK